MFHKRFVVEKINYEYPIKEKGKFGMYFWGD